MLRETFRDYDNAPPAVIDLYRRQRQAQCPCFVERLRSKYLPNSGECEKVITMSTWDALLSLDQFVDLSDPDTALPNSQHALQTAEGLRAAGAPEWMQLCGLLHDLGKVLYLKGCAADGTSANTQFAVVGDTYPVSCAVPEGALILPHIPLSDCPCSNPTCRQLDDNEDKGCGFAALTFTFGHDEYLYQVLQHNAHRAPSVKNRPIRLSCDHAYELLYVIRFHSFYPWHERGAYAEYAEMEDEIFAPLLRQFARSDLYTKHNEQLELPAHKPYYDALMKKYLGCGLDDALEW